MKSKTHPTLKKQVRHATVPLEDKSAQQLLEDLMGILNNRNELIETIIKKIPSANDGNKTFTQYRMQTKKMLSSLKTELANYGDGLAGPDPDNAYNEYWRTALKKWESINQHRLIPFWRELEKILKNIYSRTIAMGDKIPASFQTILTEQLAILENLPATKK